jgi:RNA polymerase sigma-70 factor (ECF subfamily)
MTEHALGVWSGGAHVTVHAYGDGGGVAERQYRDDQRGRMTWPPESPFSDVLGRARRLDRDALSMLYSRFLPVVYRFILARVGDAQHAEDLTSETFFATLESIQRTHAVEELGFVAWLLGIARNQVAMHFRRQRSRVMASPLTGLVDQPATTGEEGDPLEILTAREAWDDVTAALQTLTEEQQAVILYRCVLGYSAEAVAQYMGKNAGAIRALQFRALGTLSQRLGAVISGAPNSHPPSTSAKPGRRGHGHAS